MLSLESVTFHEGTIVYMGTTCWQLLDLVWAGWPRRATLAARRATVICFRKNKWLGGKAAVLNEQGFRFDMGPTILTVPKVITRIFAEAKRDVTSYLKLVRLEPQWRSFFRRRDHAGSVREPAAHAELLESAGGKRPRATGSSCAIRKRCTKFRNAGCFWKPVGGVMDTMDPLAMLKPVNAGGPD